MEKLDDLAAETIILPEDGSLTQRVVNRKAADRGIVFNRLIKTATFAVVKEAVLHGVGIRLMLEDGQLPSKTLKALPVREMPERYSVCLVTPSDKRDLRMVKSFCDVAIDASYD